MSPTKVANQPPKPWRRESAGTYRSGDERFELAGDGSGRWFVRDEGAMDELGLPRTTGPFATLAEAKAAADAQREEGVGPASPLAERLAAARSDPKAADRSEPKDARRGAAKAEQATRAGTGPAERKPSWIDELEARDQAAGREARSQIRALADLGVDDAEALVRRDRLGGRPAVVERLLVLAIRSRVAEALLDAPGSPADRAAIAARVVAAVLGAIGAEETERGLPTWTLIEAKSGRRLRPDPADGG